MILQEIKIELLDERVVGSLQMARFRSSVALPSLGRSGSVIIIWDNRNIQVCESLLGSFFCFH